MIKNILNDKNINKDFKNALSEQEFDKHIKEQINLYKKLQENIIEFSRLQKMIKSNEDFESTWRNTKFSYWKDICLKYDEKNLLNCYGDIFFIDERHENYYIGRRVLWNFELSKEQYYIDEIIDCSADGEYNFTEYKIEVKID